MKRHHSLLLLLCTAVFIACSTDGTEDELLNFTNRNNNQVSLVDINNYITASKGITTKGAESDIEVLPILSGNDTVMYIVNYHEGWELLSGDRRISKVLAMCESGNLHESDMQGNPVLSDLLATAKHQISLSLGNSISPIDNGTDTWNTAYPPASEGWICLGSQVLSHNSGVQDHLTTTKWGQQYPWNIKAPYTSQLKKNHCYTGCVMVASSQILYYLHQKENDPISTYSDCIDNASIGNGKAYISINDSDVQYFSKNSTEWDTMPLDSSESENNYRGVSTLMTRLGHLLNAVYFRDKTGAINSNIPSVLQSEYNVSCKYSSSADYSIIKNQIMTLVSTKN